MTTVTRVRTHTHTPHRLHAFSIARSSLEIYSLVGRELQELGMEGVEPRDIIDISDQYIGEGYGVASKEVKGEEEGREEG